MARASGTLALHSTGIAKASDTYEKEWRYQHNWLWRSLVGLHPSFSALANGAHLNKSQTQMPSRTPPTSLLQSLSSPQLMKGPNSP